MAIHLLIVDDSKRIRTNLRALLGSVAADMGMTSQTTLRGSNHEKPENLYTPDAADPGLRAGDGDIGCRQLGWPQ
jgi:hypothetical protein